ncbi:tumor necrosis factor ligand superfamily member 14-like isoform X1 [Thunnus thynnus]|uniref:tumor necrosis factor ligand superfamily member 14-like isoform X1 n=1 Tax=Thunnus thynnus TaxID=8237 RepID=UPI003528066E
MNPALYTGELGTVWPHHRGLFHQPSLPSPAYGHVTVSRSNKVRQCFRAARTPLFILVGLALFGLTVEAYFIKRLYHLLPAVSTQTPNTTPGQDGHNLNLSCKPFAHVVADVHNGGWPTDSCGMDYKDGRLIVQKEGRYYVYSKVSLRDSSVIQHSVELSTPQYPKNITLMKSTKYSQTTHKEDVSSSYLGGVFHLCQGCYFFVKVNYMQNLQKNSYNNFFGAFMI